MIGDDVLGTDTLAAVWRLERWGQSGGGEAALEAVIQLRDDGS